MLFLHILLIVSKEADKSADLTDSLHLSLPFSPAIRFSCFPLPKLLLPVISHTPCPPPIITHSFSFSSPLSCSQLQLTTPAFPLLTPIICELLVFLLTPRLMSFSASSVSCSSLARFLVDKLALDSTLQLHLFTLICRWLLPFSGFKYFTYGGVSTMTSLLSLNI